MSISRREAEDRLDLAEARRLAADDAFCLLRRLVASGEAGEDELVDVEAALVGTTRAVEAAYRVVAEVSRTEIREAIDNLAASGDADFRVAVKVECGRPSSPSRPPGEGPVCDRVVARVLVLPGGVGGGEDSDLWVWVQCGGAARVLGTGEDYTATCSRHGDRSIGAEDLAALVDFARRHPRRWPISR